MAIAMRERVSLIGDWVPAGLTPEAAGSTAPAHRAESAPLALPAPRSRGEKWDDFSRSVRLTARGFFSRDHMPPDTTALQKPWQRALSRVLPGEFVYAAFSEFKANPVGDLVPSGPVTQPINARAWMPRVHFENGERFYPTDPGFDNDADVTNNPYTYREGRTDGTQIPTFFVNARQRGEYTVVTYRTYFVDNPYMNRHHHDWEGFAVYLAKDNHGRLRPAYLHTSWHHHQMLVPWHELQLDAQGRPLVTIDKGAHGTRPVVRGMRLNAGRTLHPDGHWQDPAGPTPVRIRLAGDAPGLVGADPIVALADGRDPRTAYYPSTNWIAGYLKTSHGIGYGPKAGSAWEQPLHPLAWRPGSALPGQVMATIPPPPA